MIQKAMILMIRFYQQFLSPLKPQAYRCRYYPSCSQYTIEALNRFGVGKGVVLGISRLLSCHPWRQARWILYQKYGLVGKAFYVAKGLKARFIYGMKKAKKITAIRTLPQVYPR